MQCNKSYKCSDVKVHLPLTWKGWKFTVAGNGSTSVKVFSYSSTHLGPKHMQRLARYPLEKEKKIMKMMYQASWAKNTER